jgi:hypothetical protein
MAKKKSVRKSTNAKKSAAKNKKKVIRKKKPTRGKKRTAKKRIPKKPIARESKIVSSVRDIPVANEDEAPTEDALDDDFPPELGGEQ